jgi:ribulose-5-phosphate 4-epimerase/fuculose-1-phosphate aldolase
LSLKELKERVWRANLDLVEHNLVTLTWGNVSGCDRDKNWVVIKPSGLSYKELEPDNMAVVDLEGNTGRVIVERFADLDPIETPAVLVPGHGAFTWGKSPEEAVANSLALEKVAQMAWGTLLLAETEPSFPKFLLEKHYQRKHGPKAYYGQKKENKS